MRILPALCLILLFSSCGVKAPPIAPEQKIEETSVLDCSPQDPKCDVLDPKYKAKTR